MYTYNVGVDVYNSRRQRGGEEVVEMDMREWLSEVAKALVVKLAADVIEEAIKKASKPEKPAKHLRGEETE